jgi:hypothetical protein
MPTANCPVLPYRPGSRLVLVCVLGVSALLLCICLLACTGSAIADSPARTSAFGPLSSALVAGPTEDLSPPVLAGLSFSTTTIDVTSAVQAVTVRAHITDNLSGFAEGGLSFESPTARRYTYTEFGSFKRISGTALDGMYETTIPFPRYLQSGAWRVTNISLRDEAHNYAVYYPAQLEAEGLPTSVTVQDSLEDISPPVLAAMSFSPDAVNVASSAQTVTVKAHITDNLSGFAEGGLSFESPDGKQHTTFGSFKRIAGTDTDGIYEATVPFGRYVQSGAWRVTNISLRDEARNYAVYYPAQLEAEGLPTSVTVQDSLEDISPPTLATMSFSPDAVNVASSAQTITVRAHITDNLSGFAEGGLSFESPTARRYTYTEFGFFKLVSGTALDGMYETTISFPRYLQSGTWRVANLSLRDEARNYAVYYPAQLEAEGLPTSVIVVNVPPTIPPPTIKRLWPRRGPAAGGTSVTIMGANFTGATDVRFGVAEAASFKVNSATSITAISPPEGPGQVPVTVTTPAGTSVAGRRARFKFLTPRRHFANG